MARVVFMGGGVCGLAGGMMLARDGHEVTVLERDAVPVPKSPQEAWEAWDRGGVTQFRLAHFLAPAGRAVLEEDLPEVFDGLLAAGATRMDLLSLMPPNLAEAGPRAGDERFVTFTARRPVFEQVLARVAVQEPGLDVRRGAAAKGLTIDSSNGTPHVSGVHLDSGETLPADLVVDAMGRGSQLPAWLSAAGVEPMQQESEDSGFIYYGRYFRSSDGTTPQPIGPPLAPIGSFSILTLLADNSTWSVVLVASSGDRVLKRMRDPGLWTAVLRACPMHAHWLEGEPITELEAMGGVLDRHRRPVSNGRPLLTGIALLGDSRACTNPSLGRGISLGLLHARALREVVGSHLEDPQEFAEAWDATTERMLAPWYRETLEEDRERLRELEAFRQGLEPAPPSERPALLRRALSTAAIFDPDLFRAYADSRAVLKPLEQTFSENGVAERTLEVAGENQQLQIPGPSREELVAMLS